MFGDVTAIKDHVPQRPVARVLGSTHRPTLSCRRSILSRTYAAVARDERDRRRRRWSRFTRHFPLSQ